MESLLELVHRVIYEIARAMLICAQVKVRLAVRVAIGSICSLEVDRCCSSLWPIDPKVTLDSERESWLTDSLQPTNLHT